MRFTLVFAGLFVSPAVWAQPPEAAAKNQETLKWVVGLQAPEGGFSMTVPGPKVKAAASLRATSAAVRAIKYLGGEIPNQDKHAAFVLSCFDPKTGGFAEPGGKPDVALTSIGVMAAVELAIPKEKYARAMDYLRDNAKTFEDVRIGAAAVEAWGVNDCPFKLKPWKETAILFSDEILSGLRPTDELLQDGIARDLGSIGAFFYRLSPVKSKSEELMKEVMSPLITRGQRKDGGWGKKGEKSSDIETTYRVMRALMLFKDKPKDMPAVRKFVEAHRNADGGYAAKPGDPSSAGGVYYAVVVRKWLDAMEK